MIVINNKEDLLALNFHEEGQLAHPGHTTVMRTVAGWIYTTIFHGMMTSVFVPLTAKQPTEGDLQKVLNDIQIAVGPWLSASLSDPDVCDGMKQDVERFFKIIEEARE